MRVEGSGCSPLAKGKGVKGPGRGWGGGKFAAIPLDNWLQTGTHHLSFWARDLHNMPVLNY